jgi:hypothetical protein
MSNESSLLREGAVGKCGEKFGLTNYLFDLNQIVEILPERLTESILIFFAKQLCQFNCRYIMQSSQREILSTDLKIVPIISNKYIS